MGGLQGGGEGCDRGGPGLQRSPADILFSGEGGGSGGMRFGEPVAGEGLGLLVAAQGVGARMPQAFAALLFELRPSAECALVPQVHGVFGGEALVIGLELVVLPGLLCGGDLLLVVLFQRGQFVIVAGAVAGRKGRART